MKEVITQTIEEKEREQLRRTPQVGFDRWGLRMLFARAAELAPPSRRSQVLDAFQATIQDDSLYVLAGYRIDETTYILVEGHAHNKGNRDLVDEEGFRITPEHFQQEMVSSTGGSNNFVILLQHTIENGLWNQASVTRMWIEGNRLWIRLGRKDQPYSSETK